VVGPFHRKGSQNNGSVAIAKFPRVLLNHMFSLMEVFAGAPPTPAAHLFAGRLDFVPVPVPCAMPTKRASSLLRRIVEN
jgi:hypothetical protein